jgi:serine/threonine protein phosphatase 1
VASLEFTYAIPDLHGRVDLLKLAVARIVDHSVGRKAKIVTLGDYVDRGPQSAEILDFLINWPAQYPPLFPLKGNHEAMMWATCRGHAQFEWWIQNGGGQTLESYGLDPKNPAELERVAEAHLQFISDLPLIHVDRHRVFVHAGVDPALSLEQQSERVLLWKRYPQQSKEGHGARHVVHGHDADPSGPVVTSGRTNLDSLAWKMGRLVVGVFDDNVPGGACDFIEVVSRNR